MRVARLDHVDPDFPVSLVEVDPPALPRSDWARVRVSCAGICGSDVHAIYGDGGGTRVFAPFVAYPMDLGHEMVGVVTEAGPDCPVAPGTEVAVDPTLGCAARGLVPCAMCAVGAPSACLQGASGVVTDGFAHGFTRGIGSGWADELVAHHSQLHAVPAGLDHATAALTEPLSVCIHGILRRPPRNGYPVLVVGAGIIGLASVPALRSIVPDSEITVIARHAHQAEMARRLGAHHVVGQDPATEVLGVLAELSGATVVGRKDGAMLMGGYVAAIDAVGSAETLNLATRLVGQRGVVHVVGAVGTMQVDLGALWAKEIDLVGTLCHAVDAVPGGTSEHSFDHALRLLAAGALPADGFVTHTFGLEDVRPAVRTAHDRASGAIKVQLKP